MNNPKISTSKAVTSYTKRIQALRGVPAKQWIPVEGTAYTAAQVIGIFQASLDAIEAVKVKQGTLKLAVAAEHEARAAAEAVDAGVKLWAFGQYGSRSQMANDLGYQARKVAATSVDTKQRALEQAKATRKARGTVGRKARLKIKGTIPVPTVPADPAGSTSK